MELIGEKVIEKREKDTMDYWAGLNIWGEGISDPYNFKKGVSKPSSPK
tara:strand:- start:146 stop:289 length:144 start_codon:yes stop_codon:yes gene_type:complete